MADLDRLWAGWRSEYVAGAARPESSGEQCVFCALLASDEGGEVTHVVHRDDSASVILNAYPYGTGHLLVMPTRHVGDLEQLGADEHGALWNTVRDAVQAVKAAYGAPGMNVGCNLGSAAGAGIPAHLHVHVLPRWDADTNFMTAVANTRVLPEALGVTWAKLTEVWPR